MSYAPPGPSIALQTESTRCVCCDSPDSKRLFTERYTLQGSSAELGINRCRTCGLVYVSPRLTEESTRLVYERDTEHTISHNYCWDGSVSEARFRPLLRRLSEVSVPGGLLDVGCGGGHFMRAARRTGRWEVTGIDPVSSAARQAREYTGCEVEATTLERARFRSESFSVVTMLGVLEHVHDPVGLLNRAWELLDTGGVLAAYVPNYAYLRLKDAGPLCYARRGRWSELHPQEHVFQYTSSSLRRLLEQCGFVPLREDVGRPFITGSRGLQALKEAAYAVAAGLHRVTGFNAGGLEVIARKGAPGANAFSHHAA